MERGRVGTDDLCAEQARLIEEQAGQPGACPSPSAAADPDSPRRPDVTCVLIFLNGERFIEEAILSVVQQVGFDNWELLMVDDGSSDGSTAIAQHWAAVDPDRIRYVDHADHANLGMSASRNLGIALARGKFIGFLDCDDVWLPTMLAQRMRMTEAHPSADILIGGTWRWHSWTGRPGDTMLDITMSLPDAPMFTVLEPPELFNAIYERDRVPAICSILIRRAALMSIGALSAEFRGLYEDQVLYVKAGLNLRATMDPRPLALYRQHEDSACSAAVTAGEWSKRRWSAPADRFNTWMCDYTKEARGVGSPEHAIALRIAGALRSGPGRHPLGFLRSQLARLPHGLKSHARRLKRSFDEQGVVTTAQSIPVVWSRQFLEPVAATMRGSVLVVVPENDTSETWTSDVPSSAFLAASAVTRRRLTDLEHSTTYDHVVVPVATGAQAKTTVLDAVWGLVNAGGSVAAVLPGPDFGVSEKAAGPSVQGQTLGARALAAGTRRRFPNGRLWVESFGNPTTARAVAVGANSSDVRGVALDSHDGVTEVLVAMSVST